MKIESPLEVLSRAVSMVQNGSKQNTLKAQSIERRDSGGIESDSVPKYPNTSPKHFESKGYSTWSPKREPDECHLISANKPCESNKQHKSPVNYDMVRQSSTMELGESERHHERFSRKFESGECVRRSPKRLLDSDEKKVKKIKLEDIDYDLPSTYQILSPRDTCSYKCSSHHDVCTSSKIQDSHVEVLPSYMQSNPYYHPLFIFTDKPSFGGKNFSSYTVTYENLFSRPTAVSPTHPPPYSSLKCRCGNSKCTFMNDSPKYPAHRETKLSVSEDYDLPNVDEHFRKSLGEKYDVIECARVNERPSSVDEHFAKALGNKWFTLKYGRCASS